MTAPEIDSSEGIKIGDVLIHAGDVDGRDVSVDGTKLDIIDGQMSGILQKYVISDNVLHSHDADASTTNTSYTLLKTITINTLYPTPSTLRISFHMRSGNGYGVTGRIYKNGGAFGTSRATASQVGVTFSEDLAFADGDTIELWALRSVLTNTVTVKNLRVLGDDDLSLANAIISGEIGVADAWAATNS